MARPKRNYQQLSEQYRAKYWTQYGGKPTPSALFYMDDFAQIMRAADNDVERIYMALEAGYMIGYEQAMKEVRKQTKAKRAAAADTKTDL